MCHMNSEGLTGIFIHHGQHFLGPVITQLVMHEIDGPHIVRPIGTHTDDGAIFMIKPTLAFMALWQLQLSSRQIRSTRLWLTFQPGDIIATGTPPGVGMGQNPQVFLQEGQVVSASVEGLGTQKQLVVRNT